MSTRAQRRADHQDLDRARILDAAEIVFGRKDYARASLKDIADLAGYAVGSLYMHFANKEELFGQVWARRSAEYMPAMRSLLAGEGTPRERLHRLVDFQVDFFRRHPDFGRLYMRMAGTATLGHGPHVTGWLSEAFATSMRAEAARIAEGQRGGEFRPGSPDALARVRSGIMSAYHQVDRRLSDPAEGTAEFTVQELHDFVDNAFCLPR